MIIKDRHSTLLLKQCMQCSTCSVTCQISPDSNPFPRKEMLWAGWGLRDRLVKNPDIWLCHQCSDCTAKCPRDAKPGEVLGAVRRTAYKHFSWPGFMGAFFSDTKFLPVVRRLHPLTPEFLRLESIVGRRAGTRIASNLRRGNNRKSRRSLNEIAACQRFVRQIRPLIVIRLWWIHPGFGPTGERRETNVELESVSVYFATHTPRRIRDASG